MSVLTCACPEDRDVLSTLLVSPGEDAALRAIAHRDGTTVRALIREMVAEGLRDARKKR